MAEENSLDELDKRIQSVSKLSEKLKQAPDYDEEVFQSIDLQQEARDDVEAEKRAQYTKDLATLQNKIGKTAPVVSSEPDVADVKATSEEVKENANASAIIEQLQQKYAQAQDAPVKSVDTAVLGFPSSEEQQHNEEALDQYHQELDLIEKEVKSLKSQKSQHSLHQRIVKQVHALKNQLDGQKDFFMELERERELLDTQKLSFDQEKRKITALKDILATTQEGIDSERAKLAELEKGIIKREIDIVSRERESRDMSERAQEKVLKAKRVVDRITNDIHAKDRLIGELQRQADQRIEKIAEREDEIKMGLAMLRERQGQLKADQRANEAWRKELLNYEKKLDNRGSSLLHKEHAISEQIKKNEAVLHQHTLTLKEIRRERTKLVDRTKHIEAKYAQARDYLDKNVALSEQKQDIVDKLREQHADLVRQKRSYDKLRTKLLQQRKHMIREREEFSAKADMHRVRVRELQERERIFERQIHQYQLSFKKRSDALERKYRKKFDDLSKRESAILLKEQELSLLQEESRDLLANIASKERHLHREFDRIAQERNQITSSRDRFEQVQEQHRDAVLADEQRLKQQQHTIMHQLKELAADKVLVKQSLEDLHKRESNMKSVAQDMHKTHITLIEDQQKLASKENELTYEKHELDSRERLVNSRQHSLDQKNKDLQKHTEHVYSLKASLAEREQYFAELQIRFDGQRRELHQIKADINEKVSEYRQLVGKTAELHKRELDLSRKEQKLHLVDEQHKEYERTLKKKNTLIDQKLAELEKERKELLTKKVAQEEEYMHIYEESDSVKKKGLHLRHLEHSIDLKLQKLHEVEKKQSELEQREQELQKGQLALQTKYTDVTNLQKLLSNKEQYIIQQLSDLENQKEKLIDQQEVYEKNSVKLLEMESRLAEREKLLVDEFNEFRVRKEALISQEEKFNGVEATERSLERREEELRHQRLHLESLKGSLQDLHVRHKQELKTLEVQRHDLLAERRKVEKQTHVLEEKTSIVNQKEKHLEELQQETAGIAEKQASLEDAQHRVGLLEQRLQRQLHDNQVLEETWKKRLAGLRSDEVTKDGIIQELEHEREQLIATQENLIQTQRSVEKQKRQLGREQEKLATKERELSSIATHLESEREKLEHDRKTYQIRMEKQFAAYKRRIETDREELHARMDVLHNQEVEIASLSAKLRADQEALASAKKRMSQADKKLEHAKYEANLAEQLVKSNMDMKRDLDSKHAKVDKLQISIERQVSHLQQREKDLHNKQELLATEQQALHEEKNMLDKKEREVLTREKKYILLEEKAKKLSFREKNLDELDHKLHAAQQDLEEREAALVRKQKALDREMSSLEQVQTKNHHLHHRLSEREQNLEIQHRDLEHLRADIQVEQKRLERERSDLNREALAIQEKKTEMQTSRDKLERSFKKLRDDQRTLDEKQRTFEHEQAKTSELFTHKEKELLNLKSDADNKLKQAQKIQGLNNRRRDDLERLDINLQQRTSSYQEQFAKLQKQKQAVDDLQLDISKQERELDQQINDVEIIRNELESKLQFVLDKEARLLERELAMEEKQLRAADVMVTDGR